MIKSLVKITYDNEDCRKKCAIIKGMKSRRVKHRKELLDKRCKEVAGAGLKAFGVLPS
jgi:hypothetical protein